MSDNILPTMLRHPLKNIFTFNKNVGSRIELKDIKNTL